MRHIFPAIAGGVFGVCGAIAGYVIAGIPGEIVGICIAIPMSLVFGVWMGRR